MPQKNYSEGETAAVHFEQLLDADRLQRPAVDYIELRRLLDARTLDDCSYTYAYAGKVLRYLEETHWRSYLYLTPVSG